MDVIVLCVLIVALAAFVAAPLYRPRPALATDDGDRQAAVAREQAVLAAIRDLDVDRASGLIDDATYTLERGPLDAEATGLRRRLETGAD